MNKCKIYVFLLFVNVLISQGIIHSQSVAGITNKPDTSYTNFSAYNSIKKQFPYARLVSEVPSKAVKEKRAITYCKRGGRKLLLNAFYPADKSKANGIAILIIHGGGWRSGNRTQHHALAQRLAGIGYACFTPEYRLSTEALYPAAVHDLKAALRWLHKHAKKYGVDTSKVVVMGFSAGGQLAALLGTTNGNKSFEGDGCNIKISSNVQAIIDLDGTLSFVHPESGEGDDSKKTSAATYWFGYPKKENPELWKNASPLTHVGAQTPPTLFINSSVARMHAGRDDYLKVLKQNNIYAEVKTFEDAPHHFPMFEPWFTPMVDQIDNFLQHVFSKE
ncbi:MAG TPA: alpha/beta hydrolase [Flavisolibacter sp.]